MIGLIVAADPTGLIGVNGVLPWRYPADFKRFKQVTMGGTLIMGLATYRSIPGILPGRTVIVLSRTLTTPDSASDIETALQKASSDKKSQIWIAGGAQVYAAALPYVDFIDYTLVPVVTVPEGAQTTYLPKTFLEGFELRDSTVNSEDPRITHKTYVK